MIRAKCDVHPWMSAFLGVVDHPFFATTGDDGAFRFELPPGEYTVDVWHETLGTKTVPLTVESGETTSAAVAF